MLESRRHLAADLQFSSTPLLERQYAGEALPFRFTASIFNRGDVATPGPVAYRVVLASDDALEDDVLVLGDGRTDAALAPNAGAVEIGGEYAVPAAALGRALYFGVILDADHAIDALDRANDQSAQQVGIAATIVDGRFDGTAAADLITIKIDRDVILVERQPNRLAAGSFQMARVADVARLTIDLGEGDDKLDTYAGGYALTVPLAIDGGAGNDTIDGSDASDTIDGGDGDDLLGGGSPNDDRVASPADAADTLRGGAGNDTLGGNTGDDSLLGDDGDDVLVGGDGDDFAAGGAGDDVVVGNAGDDVLAGDPGNDTVRGDAGSDRVAGNAGSDRLFGGVGDDTVLGQNGRDYLHGNAGADRLIGGGGNDVLSVDLAADGVDTLSGNAGDDEAYASVSALLASIERRFVS